MILDQMLNGKQLETIYKALLYNVTSTLVQQQSNIMYFSQGKTLEEPLVSLILAQHVFKPHLVRIIGRRKITFISK
jgi:hypothetical protein